ncbi:hypothetical protein F4553_005578 [Allocatelliglobosispora scoriae]|uniref:Uncharacterized protein n=1 Tax=Allocatelliglobosispora scoriae TaxID=643052 RepID=A0A841BVC2_9ACTN|nr:hypothetical protein [Allocatelliglobosispora scoriae]MBB5872144.1 hypothetical protein [Allocatelliglobosispora scoriae]
MELNSVGACGLAVVLGIAIYAVSVALRRGDRLPHAITIPTAIGGTRQLRLTRRVGRDAPGSGTLVWRYEQRGYDDGSDTSTYWIGLDDGGERLHARPVSYELHRRAVVGARVSLHEDWRGRMTGFDFEAADPDDTARSPATSNAAARPPVTPDAAARVLGSPVRWQPMPDLLSGLGTGTPEVAGCFVPTGAFLDRRGLADNQVEVIVADSGDQLAAAIGARQGTPPVWPPGCYEAPPVPADLDAEFRGTLLLVRSRFGTVVLRVIRHGHADGPSTIDIASTLP